MAFFFCSIAFLCVRTFIDSDSMCYDDLCGNEFYFYVKYQCDKCHFCHEIFQATNIYFFSNAINKLD